MGSVKGEVQRGTGRAARRDNRRGAPRNRRHAGGEKLVCPIREQQGDRAFYSPLADYIVVPLRSQFVDMQSFYETLLHEMGHSTGHPTRLNRDLAHPFGSEEYGKEELTAEFAAALAGMFSG